MVTEPPNSPPATVLVTGGAGFIGSHACVDLLDHGYELILVDNYAHSSSQVLSRVERLAGRFVGTAYELDIRDRRALSAVFERHSVDAVMHLAAHTHQPLSKDTEMPLGYYDNNVAGTISVLSAMREHQVDQLVFSSTGSLYGDVGGGPLDERTPFRPLHPIATSKWLCERIIADVCRHRPQFTAICLRQFTPAGAHPSGLLGEDPSDLPDHLMPTVAQVAAGRRARVRVFGGDYRTPDGTAIRDYVHVMDTVEAHRLALDHLSDTPGMRLFNIGSGTGSSVLDVITTFEEVCARPVAYEITGRREGDVPELVADVSAVRHAWGWHPTRDLTAMCADAWHFEQLNPNGYAGSARRPTGKR